MAFFRKRRRKIKNYQEIDPGDVFFNAKNVSGINRKSYDDVIETPLTEKSLFSILFLFFFIFIIFIIRIFYLQIIKGEEYREIANANQRRTETIFEKRGVIKDRNNVLLAWNEQDSDSDFFKRKYLDSPGFSHLVGYLKYPKKDKKNIYYQKEYLPKTGVEKIYNEELRGKLGKKIISINAGQKEMSKIYKEKAIAGENITLAIDAEAQTLFSKTFGEYLDENEFSGGSIVIMDVHNGEVVVATSYPEYDQNILTDGSDYEIISNYFKDKRRPSLARFTYGSYTPGSVMKIFMAMAGLKEEIVDPERIFYLSKTMRVGSYLFYDWKAHGNTNMYSAISNSSNIYFYMIGGGYGDVVGLGIEKIKKYFTYFGFGEKTGIYSFMDNDEYKISEKKGVIPDKEWKKEIFNEDWYLGNTYYTAIGQYGVLVTPMQVAVATAAIANEGQLLVPKLKKDAKKEVKRILDFDKEDYEVVKKGMRGTVLTGTAQSANFNFLKIAAKTGTAEVGAHRERVNSWITGFFPYDNPRYSFVVVGDDGPSDKHNYVSLSWSKMMKELYKKNPDHIFFKKNKQ